MKARITYYDPFNADLSALPSVVLTFAKEFEIMQAIGQSKSAVMSQAATTLLFRDVLIMAMGKVDRVTGKGLSTNDYTTDEKDKLAGVATGANNYTHPAAHPASIITPDATHRFVTDAEKATWSGKADKAAVSAETTRATAEETSIREDMATGYVAMLQAAKNHTNTAVATEQVARESGDRTTLEAAKAHANKAVADLVNGSPAALDTLRELSTALGGDPNFATTVATQIGSKVDKVAGKGLSAEDYTTTEKAKLAGVAAGANNYTHPAAHPASIITPDATHRFMTDAEKATWNAKAEKTAATTSAAGLMSATDKSKLDGVAAGANNYTHPAAHPASIITPDATHRFVTDAEKAAWNKNTTSIPALRFKVSNNILMVQAGTDLTDPILKRCYIGILRYKHARTRKRVNSIGVKVDRPKNKGYKVIDDNSTKKPITWTSIRIAPIPFDVAEARLNSGWMPVMSVCDLFHRFVEVGVDPAYCAGTRFKIHAGNKVYDDDFGHDTSEKRKQKATIYCGVVLLTKDALKAYRNEGPRTFFKVFSRNYDDSNGFVALK